MADVVEMVTIREARLRFGVRPDVLRRDIRQGKIAAVWDDAVYPPRYRVSADDVRRITYDCRPWLPYEDEFLMQYVGKWSRAQIARHLERSEVAVHHRLTRLSINARSANGHYTANEVALLLGLTREGILGLIRRGEIETMAHRPIWGRNRCHMITEDAIKAFIRTRILGPPRKVPCWHWRRIEPGYFRNYAERLERGIEP